MNAPSFRVVALSGAHERNTFDCESLPLNDYFRQQVTQDIRRRITACFVATTTDGRVAAYYTLASTSLLLADLPPSIGKKLPRYPLVPAVRLGRLAVDRDFKGQGLGGAMLADALSRASRSEIASCAMLVEAKDDTAAAFYLHHGFIPLQGPPLSFFLPFATSSKLPR